MRRALMAAMLLLSGAAAAKSALEAPIEPFDETEFFTTEGAVGTLVLPAGAPDRRTSAIVILQDGEQPDGRASRYTDQLLGAGFAVLEMVYLPGDGLAAVLTALALHPRVAGQPIGLLGFGAGARLIASLDEPVAARALLYPGCDGIAPSAMQGQAIMLMHGAEDPANETSACETLSAALTLTGATVRLRVLGRATYAWDRPAFGGEARFLLPRPDGKGLVTVDAWPAMAALSAAEIAGFFATNLLGPRP